MHPTLITVIFGTFSIYHFRGIFCSSFANKMFPKILHSLKFYGHVNGVWHGMVLVKLSLFNIPVFLELCSYFDDLIIDLLWPFIIKVVLCLAVSLMLEQFLQKNPIHTTRSQINWRRAFLFFVEEANPCSKVLNFFNNSSCTLLACKT